MQAQFLPPDIPSPERAPAMPEAEAMSPMSPAPAGGDLSQGYCVEVHVLPDGTFGMSGPEPLEMEAAEGENPSGDQQFQSVGEALQAVLAVIRDNPVGGAPAAEAEMEAGYAAG